MHPVRIVTLVAVSVGSAMGAGWLFQPEDGLPTAEVAAADQNLATARLSPVGGAADGLGSLLAGAEPAAAAAPERPAETLAEAAPALPVADITLHSEDGGAHPPAPPSVAALTEVIAGDATAPLVEPDTLGAVATSRAAPMAAQAPAECMTALVVTSEAAAMLEVTLFAPCEAGKTVSVSHGPLRLAAALDANGQIAMALPALAPQAEVSVSFPDGHTVTDRTDVPDFSQFSRLILQWDGAARADLNAYSGGAAWGEDGHIHADSPVLASAGFVTALGGADGQQARIFTYPAGRAPGDPAVQVEAEVAVSEANCGRPFEARVYTIRAEAPVGHRAMRVEMPPCDGTGGFVLLQDILPDQGSSVAALN